MRAIIRTSLRFKLLVLAIAAGVLAVGIAQLRDAPVDVLPEFTPPYAEIQTEALGLSAEEVENLITVPLEADLLNGVEGVDVIRSQSLPSLSSIVLVFEPGTDVYRARQLVQERLIQAHSLPRVSKPPTLLQPLSSSSRVAMIGLSSDELSSIEQSVIARWTMRPRLMGVPGVANVAVWGMRDQQLQVQVDPERLRDQRVELSQVVATAGNAQVVSPLSFLMASTPGTGGFIETPQQRLQVRHVLEKMADPKELGRVPVEGTGGRLRLSDVSDVAVGHPPLIGDAIVDGGEGLMLVVEKFPGASTLEVTRGVEEALETLKPGLAGMRSDPSVFRPASYIESAIDNVGLAVLTGSALALLALAVLLFQWRLVVIALVTIPLSLIAAALTLDAFGLTFNALTIAGLAVAVAIILDDAVVATDNLARRAREHRARGEEGRASETVLAAIHEMRSPLAYATLIALLAILPVAVMQGRPGAFFESLVAGYALAIVASGVVALTVTPALALLLGGRGLRDRESPLIDGLRPRYHFALAKLVGRPTAVLLVVAGFAVVALVSLPLLPTTLLPAFKDRDVLIRLESEPGTSQPRMAEMVREVVADIEALPGVERVGAHLGRAVTGDAVVDVNSSDVWVSVAAGADYDETVERLDNVVAGATELDGDVASYSAQRIRDVGALVSGSNEVEGSGVHVLTGSRENLVARVYGQDLDVLAREAERVRGVMSEVDGVVDPRVARSEEQSNLEIEVDLTKARRFGIKPGDVRRAEATLVQGIQVGSVFEDQRVFDVLVQGVPEIRRTPDDVRNLLIDRPGGGHVRLGEVADVRVALAPVAIQRDAVSRYIDVVAGVSGRDTADVAADIRGRLANVALPLEYHAEVIGATTGEEIGIGGMLAAALIAAIAVFLLLQAAVSSWRVGALALALLPVALSGGVIAALITGAELSLGSLIGFLALLVLAVRHFILLLRRYGELSDSEAESSGDKLVARGANERLAPIVTSAAALALLLMPMVIIGPDPGLEILHPMAVVILGGLVTSTLLALFALPILYLRFGPVSHSHAGLAAAVSSWPRMWRNPLARSRPRESVSSNGGDHPSFEPERRLPTGVHEERRRGSDRRTQARSGAFERREEVRR